MRRRDCLVLLALAIAAPVSGCGFRLQGRQALPALLGTVYVDADERQSDFVLSLRKPNGQIPQIGAPARHEPEQLISQCEETARNIGPRAAAGYRRC